MKDRRGVHILVKWEGSLRYELLINFMEKKTFD